MVGRGKKKDGVLKHFSLGRFLNVECVSTLMMFVYIVMTTSMCQAVKERQLERNISGKHNCSVIQSVCLMLKVRNMSDILSFTFMVKVLESYFCWQCFGNAGAVALWMLDWSGVGQGA